MGKDFETLMQEYYAQALKTNHNSSVCYSETYNETGVIYFETENYSESVTPEEIDTSF